MSSRRCRGGGTATGKRLSQPEVEIAAKLLLSDHLFQVPIGRGHQAYIHALRMGATRLLKLLFLKNSQQLGLELERNISDFIEEKQQPSRQYKNRLVKLERSKILRPSTQHLPAFALPTSCNVLPCIQNRESHRRACVLKLSERGSRRSQN
jgi:hypothetical protein